MYLKRLNSFTQLLPDNYHPKLYLPFSDRSTISIVDDHEYKLTFKSYCIALKMIEDGNIIGASVALDAKNPVDKDEFDLIWDIIHKQRWKAASRDYKAQGLDDETIKLLQEAETDFDMLKDFDAYAPDFLKEYNIDLYENDIELFKFFDLLFALMSFSSSCISKRISIRNSKYDKNAGVAYNVAMQQKKEQYAL